MQIRVKWLFFATLLSATLILGCGGGGGGSSAVGVSATANADQLLASQLLGTWKLSQATKDGKLVPVLPTDAGEIGTISFNADQTATGNDYIISTSTGATLVDPNDPTPPPTTDYYKTTLVVASDAVHSWVISNGMLIVQAASGNTLTNSIEIKNGELYQTMPNGEIQVWKR